MSGCKSILTNQKNPTRDAKVFALKPLLDFFLTCFTDLANPKTTAYGKPDEIGKKGATKNNIRTPRSRAPERPDPAVNKKRKEVNVWFLTIH